jgi:hypothetical protein
LLIAGFGFDLGKFKSEIKRNPNSRRKELTAACGKEFTVKCLSLE